MAVLNVPSNGVATPNAPAPNVAPLDFSKLFPDYAQGVQFAQAQALHNAFAGPPGSPTGIPTVDGTATGAPNYAGIFQRFMQNGDFADANAATQAGINQQTFNIAKKEAETPLTPPNTAGAPPPPQSSAAAAPVNNNAPAPQSNYNTATGQHESGGGASSTNIYQFHQDTWDGIAAKHPELGLPATPDQATPAQQAQANTALAANNGAQLAQAGLPVNDKTLYTAHFFGAPQATKFLSALGKDAGQLAAPMFPTEAAANPSIFYNKDGSSRNDACVCGSVACGQRSRASACCSGFSERCHSSGWRGFANGWRSRSGRGHQRRERRCKSAC